MKGSNDGGPLDCVIVIQMGYQRACFFLGFAKMGQKPDIRYQRTANCKLLVYIVYKHSTKPHLHKICAYTISYRSNLQA